MTFWVNTFDKVRYSAPFYSFCMNIHLNCNLIFVNWALNLWKVHLKLTANWKQETNTSNTRLKETQSFSEHWAFRVHSDERFHPTPISMKRWKFNVPFSSYLWFNMLFCIEQQQQLRQQQQKINQKKKIIVNSL